MSVNKFHPEDIRNTPNPYPAEEVASHNTRDSCWVTENGNVYNVTGFLDKHPGGADLILPHAGRVEMG